MYYKLVNPKLISNDSKIKDIVKASNINDASDKIFRMISKDIQNIDKTMFKFTISKSDKDGNLSGEQRHFEGEKGKETQEVVKKHVGGGARRINKIEYNKPTIKVKEINIDNDNNNSSNNSSNSSINDIVGGAKRRKSKRRKSTRRKSTRRKSSRKRRSRKLSDSDDYNLEDSESEDLISSDSDDQKYRPKKLDYTYYYVYDPFIYSEPEYSISLFKKKVIIPNLIYPLSPVLYF